MALGSLDTNSRENTRITLGLLEAVGSGKAPTQRGLAVDLRIALGLVNVYLKRCVKKGLVKVSQAPARRFAYYLTPQGFAEKSRLTADFLAWSLTFFRQAKESCGSVFDQAHALGWRRIVLVGSGDLADIARICATDRGLVIVAIVDPDAANSSAGGPPLLPGFDAIGDDFDGVIVTDLTGRRHLRASTEHAVGRQRILTPSLVPSPSPAGEVNR